MEKEIRARIEEQLLSHDTEKIEVVIDGNRANIEVVSDVFVGMSRVARQQLIYSCINDLIQDGRLHAVSITTRTLSEI